MLFYKIYLLQPYDTEDEIGNRPLIRCFQKTGVGTLVEDCYPFIVAYVDESLFIRELFTGQLLKRSNICNKPFFGKEDNLRFNDLSRFKSESISSKEELYSLLSLKRNKDFVNAITTAIFNIPNEFELSTPEELTMDQAIQLEAFENGLTTISPYSERYIESKAPRQKR